MKIIDLGWLEGHWQLVRSAILATAGLLVRSLLCVRFVGRKHRS